MNFVEFLFQNDYNINNTNIFIIDQEVYYTQIRVLLKNNILNIIGNFLKENIPIHDYFLIILFLFILILFILNFNFYLYIFNSFKFLLIELLGILIRAIEDVNFTLIKYSLYLITIFLFILLLNILGLIPYVKSFTSTLSINFFLAITSFFSLTIEGLRIQKFFFFDKFAPANVPFAILPGLVLIELISYFMRPNSLAIRLFSNMLAGHILIKLFISFCLTLSSISLLLFFSCFYFIGILMILEVFISFLQAYIFMLLLILYLDDILNSQH